MDRKVNGRYLGLVCTFRAELFRRDQPHLCELMTLTKYKSKKTKKTAPAPYSTPLPASTECGAEKEEQITTSSTMEMTILATPTNTWTDLMMMQQWNYPLWQNNLFASTPTHPYHTPQHKQQMTTNRNLAGVPNTNYQIQDKLHSSNCDRILMKCSSMESKNFQVYNNPTALARAAASESYPRESTPKKQFCRMHSAPVFPSNPNEYVLEDTLDQRTKEDKIIDDQVTELQRAGRHLQESKSYDHPQRARQTLQRKTVCHGQEYTMDKLHGQLQKSLSYDQSNDCRLSETVNFPNTSDYGKEIDSSAAVSVAAADLFQDANTSDPFQEAQHVERPQQYQEHSATSTYSHFLDGSVIDDGNDPFALVDIEEKAGNSSADTVAKHITQVGPTLKYVSKSTDLLATRGEGQFETTQDIIHAEQKKPLAETNAQLRPPEKLFDLDGCSLASSVENLDLLSLASIGSDEYVLS